MKNNTVLKNFMKYVSLNVLGMIGLSCYILADTFFVSGALGATGLAALNFSISIYCFIQGAGLMVGIGGATKYTIFKSQNEHQKANAVFVHTILFGIVIGIFLLFSGVVLSNPIAKLLGADDSTLPLTVTYLTTILCFSPCFIINNILLAFIRNDGNPRLSMSAMLLGSFSNIILDYIFMFPLSMGMFGAAFATGLAPIISIGLLSIHFVKHKNNFWLTRCKVKIKYIADIVNLGLSAFVTEMSSGIVLIIFNLVILKLEGNVGVAAYGIVANLALVVIAIFTGIAQGIQPLASKGYGTSDTCMLRQILRHAVILSFAVATIIYIVTILCSNNIIEAFNSENNKDLIPIATNGFRLYFIGFFFAGFNIISAAYLSATAKAKSAFVISVTRGCVAIIPLVFVLTLLFSMNGVWLSFTFSEMITSIIAIIYLAKIRRTSI
ncbi:MATE family efflux transporter [Clostridium sp.]|uniref:MATE family efflux transporter n=1 Tax=Clostridium sp. TaxID=1506 RepID=UPI00321802AA